MTTVIIAATALTATMACSSKGEKEEKTAPEDYDTVLVSAGRQAATEALSYPSGSTERENAILAIRAAEYRLRQAGMVRSADSFVAGAGELLDTLK